MAVEITTGFKILVLVMLFYSASISIITATIPADAVDYIDIFNDDQGRMNLNSTGAQLQQGLEQQRDIPVIEIAALVFYSGNILIDLILNFIFAIPEMVGFILAGIMLLISLPVEIAQIIELFSAVAITAWYAVGLIQMLTNVRSGRLV